MDVWAMRADPLPPIHGIAPMYLYHNLFDQVSHGWRFKVLLVFTIKNYVDVNTVALLSLCTFVYESSRSSLRNIIAG